MRPLDGVRVVVTRAAGQAGSLASELEALGATVIPVPLLAFVEPVSWAPVDRAIAHLDGYAAIAFTSTNAVARFWERLHERVGACDRPALPAGVRVVAVGSATAAALAARGVFVDAVPQERRASALAIELERVLGGLAGRRVLLPRAEEGREELPARVREAGGEVDVAPVYRTVMPEAAPADLARALAARPHAVTLASGSAAEHLVAALGGRERASSALGGVVLAAIGPVTAARVRELGLGEPLVAESAGAAELAAALAGIRQR